jgi:thiol-disulfide isomerase/thioredoxin
MFTKNLMYIIIAILIGLGIYYNYSYYFSHRVRFNERSNKYHEAFDGSSEPASLNIFYTEWCGYCKKFKPIYETELPTLIKEEGINCTIDAIDADKNTDLATKYGVKGYPTVILELTDGTLIPYDGDREAKPIIEFLRKHVNK